ncbi:MAG: heme ABC exporter ATP-binding protein CcmA [Parvibaculales bacterium]
MNSEKKDKDKDEDKTEVILDNITIRRGARLVLRDFSLAIKSGEAWAVQGGNGAGKTTLLRLLAGLVRPTMGCLRLIGAKNLAQAGHYLGHLDGLKNLRTVHEEIIYQAALYGSSPPHPTKFLHILGLAECAPMPIGDLSAGQRRRLTLARLLLAPRPIWLLDEPFTALDVQGCALVAGLVATHIKKGGMAVVASHAPLNFATHHLDLEEKNN